MQLGKKGSAGILVAIIFGFIALYVGAQLVPEIWYTIIGSPSRATNGTTKLFIEMVPWMSAIGLMVSAVTVFIAGAKRRL